MLTLGSCTINSSYLVSPPPLKKKALAGLNLGGYYPERGFRQDYIRTHSILK